MDFQFSWDKNQIKPCSTSLHPPWEILFMFQWGSGVSTQESVIMAHYKGGNR